jgi:hypothetical protein
VIDLRRGRPYLRERYELNMHGLARRHDLEIVWWVRLDADLTMWENPILRAREITGATAVITPSLEHLRDGHRWIIEWADIYTVGRSQTHRHGHRWR